MSEAFMEGYWGVRLHAAQDAKTCEACLAKHGWAYSRDKAVAGCRRLMQGCTSPDGCRCVAERLKTDPQLELGKEDFSVSRETPGSALLVSQTIYDVIDGKVVWAASERVAAAKAKVRRGRWV